MDDRAVDRAAICHTRTDLVYRRLVEGGMVYDGRTRLVHHLNEAAAVAWEACGECATAESAAAHIQFRFDVGADQALDDATQILAVFRREGLLVGTAVE